MWLCKCSCKDKTEKIICGSELRRGNSTNCGCNYSQSIRDGYLWEDLVRQIAYLLYPGRVEWQPRIPIENNKYIIPEIRLYHINSIEFIDAKKSINALKQKDIEIYPIYADKVTFWLLHGKTKQYKNYNTISSNNLIRQLSRLENTSTLIQQIYDLKNRKDEC